MSGCFKSYLQDLAAINSREDILKYLDAAGAQQEATNPKLAKSLQVEMNMLMKMLMSMLMKMLMNMLIKMLMNMLMKIVQ